MTLPLRDPHERRPARLKRFATLAVHLLDRLTTADDAALRDRIDLYLRFELAPVDDAPVGTFTHRTRQQALRGSYPFRAGIAAQGVKIRSVPGHILGNVHPFGMKGVFLNPNAVFVSGGLRLPGAAPSLRRTVERERSHQQAEGEFRRFL